MTRAKVTGAVLPCPTCPETYEIIIALVWKDAAREPDYRYELPDNCTQCGTPLDTVRHHMDIRDSVALLLDAPRGAA